MNKSTAKLEHVTVLFVFLLSTADGSFGARFALTYAQFAPHHWPEVRWSLRTRSVSPPACFFRVRNMTGALPAFHSSLAAPVFTLAVGTVWNAAAVESQPPARKQRLSPEQAPTHGARTNSLPFCATHRLAVHSPACAKPTYLAHDTKSWTGFRLKLLRFFLFFFTLIWEDGASL